MSRLSEVDLHGKLRLPRRPGLLELPERRRRIGRVGADSEDVVDVGEVGAVEQIEDVDNRVDAGALAERDATAEAQVDADLTGQGAEVAANARRQISRHSERAIGSWNRAAVAVAIEILAGQNVV